MQLLCSACAASKTQAEAHHHRPVQPFSPGWSSWTQARLDLDVRGDGTTAAMTLPEGRQIQFARETDGEGVPRWLRRTLCTLFGVMMLFALRVYPLTTLSFLNLAQLLLLFSLLFLIATLGLVAQRGGTASATT